MILMIPLFVCFSASVKLPYVGPQIMLIAG